MDIHTALQLLMKARRVYQTFVADVQDALKGHAGREYETAKMHIDNAKRNPSRAREELNSAHSALDRVHRTWRDYARGQQGLLWHLIVVGNIRRSREVKGYAEACAAALLEAAILRQLGDTANATTTVRTALEYFDQFARAEIDEYVGREAWTDHNGMSYLPDTTDLDTRHRRERAQIAQNL